MRMNVMLINLCISNKAKMLTYYVFSINISGKGKRKKSTQRSLKKLNYYQIWANDTIDWQTIPPSRQTMQKNSFSGKNNQTNMLHFDKFIKCDSMNAKQQAKRNIFKLIRGILNWTLTAKNECLFLFI